jgi:hypothetical protein
MTGTCAPPGSGSGPGGPRWPVRWPASCPATGCGAARPAWICCSTCPRAPTRRPSWPQPSERTCGWAPWTRCGWPRTLAPGLLLGYGNLSDRLVDEAVAVPAGILGQAGR